MQEHVVTWMRSAPIALVVVIVVVAVAFTALFVEVVASGEKGIERRWFLHYDLSYSGGQKSWKTPDHAFPTLEDCLQFVGQGSWAKAEHCDGSWR